MSSIRSRSDVRVGVAAWTLALSAAVAIASSDARAQTTPGAATEAKPSAAAPAAGSPSSAPAAAKDPNAPAPKAGAAPVKKKRVKRKKRPAAPAAAPPAPPPPKAQSSRTKMGGKNRELNGHTFILPSNVPSAMINGLISFRQGFGVLHLQLPTLDSYAEALASGDGSKVVRARKNLFLYGQELAGTIGIMNRVGVDLYAGGLAAAGGDLESIVMFGSIAQLNVGAMPKVRVITADKIGLQLSAGLAFDYERDLHVAALNLLSQGLQGAANDPNLASKLIEQDSSFRLVPTLLVAEGIGPLGIQGFFRRAIPLSGEGKSLDFGGHLAFDVGQLVRAVPVAVTGEYVVFYDVTKARPTHDLGGGLYYSGRRDFNLGGVVSGSFTKNDDGSPLSLFLGQLVLQYYF